MSLLVAERINKIHRHNKSLIKKLFLHANIHAQVPTDRALRVGKPV
jgi:hypothetical protein